MTKLNLIKIVESLDESQEKKFLGTFNYITPEGTVNFHYLPSLSQVLYKVNSPSPQDFNDLLPAQNHDAEDILEAIKLGNVTLPIKNPVYDLYKNLLKVIKTGQVQSQNSTLKSKPKQLYIDALGDISSLATEMLKYHQYLRLLKSKNLKSAPIGIGNLKNTHLQIKDFKNLSTFIHKSPPFANITDNTFSDFLQPNNQEAQNYYDKIIDGDDSGEASNTKAGIIFSLFQALRQDCDQSITNYTNLHHNMNKLNNYYGLNSTETNKTKTKEFFSTKSLNMDFVKKESLIKFTYKLLDTNGKPYRGSDVVYSGIFTYHLLKRTYQFINSNDLNNEFFFEYPKPNPINIGQSYNIRYTSRTEHNTYLKIYIINIETEKSDVVHEFINCTAVDELKELLKSIRGQVV